MSHSESPISKLEMIHPTAIIHSSAKIGEGTTVGPYCVIEANVEIGAHCVIHNHVTIAGPTKIGNRNLFFPYCSVGQRSQDLKYIEEPTYLEIGNDNCFREFCTLNRGTAPGSKTAIGNHGNFLAYSHIAHDCVVGNHVIFSNNGTLAGHVIVEDYAVIGGLTGVHQFCRIGQHAITGGCTKIVQDVPPFMVADGNPAEIRGINQIGLERRDFEPEIIRSLREAYRLIYRSNLNTKQAVVAIREQIPTNPQLEALIIFIESSKRGIVH